MKKLIKLFVAGLFAASVGQVTLHAADYNVKIASSSNVNVTAGTIKNVGVTVTDVYISSAGTSSSLNLFNASGSTSVASQLLGFGTTATGKFENLNVAFPNGLTVDADGSPSANWTICYRLGTSGFEVNRSSYSATAVTAGNLKNGAGVFERVIIAKSNAAATGAQVFNSSASGASAINQLASVDGVNSIDQAFSVNFSSGLTVTRTGAAGVSVIYK